MNLTNELFHEIATEDVKKTKRLDFIDALRGLAIVLIIIIHSYQSLKDSLKISFSEPLLNQGARGVQLLFLISALSLFISRVNNKEKYTPFIIRRFLRLALLYYFGIIIYTVFVFGFGPRVWAPEGVNLFHFILNLTLLNSLYPSAMNSIVPGGWAISLIMIFSTLIPILYQRIKNIYSAIFLLIISILVSSYFINMGCFLDCKYENNLWGTFKFLSFPTQLPIFLAGILVYFIIKKIIKTPLKFKTLNYYYFSLALFIISLLAFFYLAYLNQSEYKFLFYGIVFIIMTVSLSIYPHGLIVNNFFINIGKLSFSLYLWHFLIIEYLSKNYISKLFNIGMFDVGRDIKLLVFVMTVISIGILCSLITYNLIEIPGMKLGKYLAKKYS